MYKATPCQSHPLETQLTLYSQTSALHTQAPDDELDIPDEAKGADSGDLVSPSDILDLFSSFDGTSTNINMDQNPIERGSPQQESSMNDCIAPTISLQKKTSSLLNNESPYSSVLENCDEISAAYESNRSNLSIRVCKNGDVQNFDTEPPDFTPQEKKSRKIDQSKGKNFHSESDSELARKSQRFFSSETRSIIKKKPFDKGSILPKSLHCTMRKHHSDSQLKDLIALPLPSPNFKEPPRELVDEPIEKKKVL